MLAIRLKIVIVFECVICIIISQLLWYSNSQCSPSSCGSIHNIAKPFRLSTDPESCGDPNPFYVLACERNRTVITFDSQKYYVKSINYDNHTIRLVDPGVQKSNICSLPRNSLFPRSLYLSYFRNTASVNFFSCPFPINSSSFVQLSSNECGSSSGGDYAYAKLGPLAASELRISCRVEAITLTSWRIRDNDITHLQINVTLLDIHDALLYGFEMPWLGEGISPPWPERIRLRIVAALQSLLSCVIGRFVIGVPCLIVFLIIKLKRRHLSVFDAIEDFLRAENNLFPVRYSYRHIKNMTKGFKEKLGEGGFGSVYKGKLRSGGDVAVKIISKPKSNGQDFINEVGSLGRIHHVNVVRLVGYCAEHSRRALVYDFMPNGSLNDYIGRESKSPLSWRRRFEIAVGVARGIEYLHRGCDIQILHFDIKPHNILLDEDFVPKISDFGLAKLFPTDKSIITLTAARGTIGYVAPELINRRIGAVSHKADVYSFGMLLMEMLGLKGSPPIAEEGESSKYFPTWIRNDIDQGRAIDLGEEDEEEKRITRKMIIVGLWCIQTSPVPRPSMSRVVQMLQGDVELLEMPAEDLFDEPIVEDDHEKSSLQESSESISFFGNTASSSIKCLEIIVD